MSTDFSLFTKQPEIKLPPYAKINKTGGANSMAFMDPMFNVAPATKPLDLTFGSSMNDFSDLSKPGAGDFTSGLGTGSGPSLFKDDNSFSMFGSGTPDKLGGWVKGAQVASSIGELGLGIYSAIDQAKMNKFMRGYYGDQVALQTADFQNNAKSANEALAKREQSRQSARGIAYDDPAMQQNVASYMDKWGAKETV